MPMLHDPAVRDTFRNRIQALRPDAPRQWGKMSVDQMLWHVNAALSSILGKTTHEPVKSPLPAPVFRFLVLNMPWPKGSPTHPDYIAGARYDFDGEKARCLALLEEFTRKSVDSPWPASPLFGKVTGTFASRLQAKHVDHHLRQFGA